MSPLIFALPGQEGFAAKLCARLDEQFDPAVALAQTTMRRFPDGETYVRVDEACEGRDALIVCSLDQPDAKVLPLFFLADTLRDLGARRVGLVAPYLAYMRQDIRFHPGEGITSRYFAKMVSRHLDWLVTVDPHLHRYDSLDEIYEIDSRVVPAAPKVAAWIAENIERPLLIGPDSESEQWVSAVADKAEAPCLVLQKERHGDRDVRVSVPEVDRWRDHTPVLFDDIVSTGHTMIETLEHLAEAGMKPAVVVAVHGIFADDAHQRLLDAGAAKVVTTNTITDATNAIDLSGEVAQALTSFL